MDPRGPLLWRWWERKLFPVSMGIQMVIVIRMLIVVRMAIAMIIIITSMIVTCMMAITTRSRTIHIVVDSTR